MDPEMIYDTDIDPRVEDGYVLADSDLMTYEEWWDEFLANACCRDSYAAALANCGCGGTPIPYDISPLLAPEEVDGETLYLSRMDSLADYRKERE